MAVPGGKEDQAAAEIENAARRRQASRKTPPPSPLSGLGTFGMVGWSVAVPTVAGVFLGLWLDRVMPQDFSWTVALLLGGAVIGAAIAWRWIGKAGRQD